MRTKNIIIIIAALALGWLAASCAKQNEYDSFKETTDSRFGTVEEQREYLEGVLVTIGEEQVELEAYLEDLEETSNVHAHEVDSLIDDLDGRVKAVLDTLENFARKDSMEATFATLTVIDSLCDVTAAIEVKVKSDSTTLTDSLKNKIAATHAAVTEKFKSYYTKDSLNTLLKVQSDRLDSLSKNADSARTEIANLQKSIDELKKKHEEISKKLDEEMKILKESDTGIEEKLKILDATTTEKFATLEPKVTANTQAIAALEARVKKLELRVQSIEVVPDYADGSVDVWQSTSSIRFEVRPRYLIDSLAGTGKEKLFSFQIIKTTAATKAGIFVDTLTITSVTKSAEDSLLIVTVNGAEMHDDFFDTTQTYSARLVLSDHNTDRASAYFPLMPCPGPQYPEAPDQPCVKIGNLWWAPVNCGYDANHKYGLLYQWGRKYGQGYDGEFPLCSLSNTRPTTVAEGSSDANKNKFFYGYSCWTTQKTSWTDDWFNTYNPCPSGWRLPNGNEFNQLLSAGSSWTSQEEINGRLFAGKLFLPAAGSRIYDTGTASKRGEEGKYWTSMTNMSGDPRDVIFDNANIEASTTPNRAFGFSVRCIYGSK